MMKNIILVILFTLVSAQFAVCHAENFQVSAVIPLIPGVNYFPATADLAPSMTADQGLKDTMKEMILRDGKQFVLQTSIAK